MIKTPGFAGGLAILGRGRRPTLSPARGPLVRPGFPAILAWTREWFTREGLAMFRIKRFGIMKTATVVAVLYLLIVAIFVVPAVILVAAFGGNNASAGVVGLLAVGAVLAVVYAIGGWIVTAIACALYNVAASWTGGIEVQVEAVAPPAPAPVWGPVTTPPPAG